MKKEKTDPCIGIDSPEEIPGVPGTSRFSVSADSYTGLVRTRNEDSFLYAFDSSGRFLLTAVADGIGGGCDGDIAGNFAAKMLLMAWRDFAISEMDAKKTLPVFLSDTFKAINQRIYQVNQLRTGGEPMGTTLAVAVFLPDAAVLAHAGDSRIYQVRSGAIRQLTCDHNLANEMIRNGQIPPEEAFRVPGGKLLTQAIGPNPAVEPETAVEELETGDKFLLCSDGLTLHVSDQEILDTLDTERTPSGAVKTLCRLTLHRGARDNTTLILVQVK